MVNAIQNSAALVTATTEEVRIRDKILREEKDNVGTKGTNKIADNIIKLDNKIENEDKSINKVDFSKLSKQLQSMIGNSDMEIKFSIDKDTKKMIIKVINKKTNEVVQQYPPDIALKIARIVSSAIKGGSITDAVV